MPYLAFARKWRPTVFQEVVGQQHVITTLQNTIAVQRIGHAYLFSGPRGIGKTTVARILAKAVNCLQISPDETHPEPCNECNTCVQINSGKSFDVIEIDAASNRGIDEIRELRENVRLAPALCRYKVYIIDEVHMLTQEAFNALLKTLEEPPSHVIFILATTERHKIPLTILSRCQPFDFTFISQPLLVERLRAVCSAEEIEVDDESLNLIAEQSEGCLRDAQNLLEQLTASAGSKIDSDEVYTWLGLGAQHLLDGLIQAILRSDLQGGLKSLMQLADQGADLSQCLRKLISYLADLRRLKIDSSLESLLNVSVSKLDKMRHQLSLCSHEQLTRSVHVLIKASNDIRQYGFEQLQLESALITICRESTGIPVHDVLQKLTELEGRLENSCSEKSENLPLPATIGRHTSEVRETSPQQMPSPDAPIPSVVASEKSSELSLPDDEIVIYEEMPETTPRPELAEPPEASSHPRLTDVDPNNPQQIWQALLNELETRQQTVITFYLRTAQPGALRNGVLEIRFDRLAVRNMMSEADQAVVEEYLSTITQKPMKVELKVVSSETEEPNSRTKNTTHWARISEAERDDTVRMVMEAFDGQVIDVQASA